MATWAEIEAKVTALTKGVGAAADLVAARREYKMAGPAAVADRLKALKQTIEAESDKLLGEIEGIASQKVPGAFAKGRQFLAGMQQDVDNLEAELSQLTNLPLGN